MNTLMSSELSYEEVRNLAIEHITPLFSNPISAHTYLTSLPIQHSQESHNGWIWIQIPTWASWTVPSNLKGIFLPRFSESSKFEDYPWWRAIVFYINLEFEKTHKRQRGSTYSNSKPLGRLVSHAYDYAWVNRIAALLKAWCAYLAGKSIQELFGEMPIPKIYITHDVDAIHMSFKLRIKQATSRALSGQLFASFRILTANDDDDFFETMLNLEKSFEYHSTWLIYVNLKEFNGFKSHVLDPEYSLSNKNIILLVARLKSSGHEIGLHSSFKSWNNLKYLKFEKLLLSNLTKEEPKCVRQHWLRFGVHTTWNLQKYLGFLKDFTLGFNDRVGFRAATALPLRINHGNFFAVPTVIMDSHLYSRQYRTKNGRYTKIDEVLNELELFGGCIAINWHPHTLGKAYGWINEYNYLLASLKNRQIEVVT